MTSSRDVSSFDIIGPIMVGPSSSHTAGAVRLGLIGRAVLGCRPTTAKIILHGSFAQTGKGHGTDRAIVAGLLGMATDDARIRSSFAIAAESNLDFHFDEADLGADAHPNSVRLLLDGEGQQVDIVGASVGGGMVQVTSVQGYPATFGGEYDTLLVIADDRPGTINLITRWLLEHQLNIAFFRVERQKRRGRAIMIIEIDETIPDDVPGAIELFSWVHWVRRIRKVSG